ncbi:MAG: protein translocase subunit SecF [Pseudomonadales bacterium]
MSDFKVINFMRTRKITALISVIAIVASIVSISVQGLNLGLDFSGGTLLELQYDRPADVEEIRTDLVAQDLPSATVVYFGSDSDILIRVSDNLGQERAENIARALAESSGAEIDLQRVEYVGPQVGEELREDGGLGMVAALLVVMLYVAVRFQYKFSIGAVAALFHDVIITLGLFSIFRWEFDLTVLAALLAVIGYSLNDTIVVFDRIRENFRSLRGKDPEEVVNISLTQTLSRTIITGLTTLLVLVVLFIMGGEMIHYFSLALILGIIIGTYSSIFVASSLVLTLNIEGKDLVPPEDDDKSQEIVEEVPYS